MVTHVLAFEPAWLVLHLIERGHRTIRDLRRAGVVAGAESSEIDRVLSFMRQQGQVLHDSKGRYYTCRETPQQSPTGPLAPSGATRVQRLWVPLDVHARVLGSFQ